MGEPQAQADWKPSPDPTVLTTVQIDEKIEALRKLMDERFSGIQVQFRERDTRVTENAILIKSALDAALQAAKESVSVSGTATTKLLDAIALTVTTLGNSLSSTINDLKDRVGAIEGRSGGMSSLYGWIIAAVGLVFSGIGIVIALVVYLSHSNATAVAPIVIPK